MEKISPLNYAIAEGFLTKKKGDRQHRPSINSCLVRIPGTIISKCGQAAVG